MTLNEQRHLAEIVRQLEKLAREIRAMLPPAPESADPRRIEHE